MPNYSRRLEDRIQLLSARAIVETDPIVLYTILLDLRSALRQYVEGLRERAAAALARVPDSTAERRKDTDRLDSPVAIASIRPFTFR